jgi:hypothetical protein
MQIEQDQSEIAPRQEHFNRNLLWHAIIFSSLSFGNISYADSLFLPRETTGRGGKLTHIDQSEIHFQLGCKGEPLKYSAQAVDTTVQFNTKCSNIRIDAFGGDDPGCGPPDSKGMNFRGAKQYFQVVARNKKDYAFKSINFGDDMLKGQLLISGKEFSLSRAEIDTVSRVHDCYYKKDIN